jgi:8-oxo-dGTP diphosphatase
MSTVGMAKKISAWSIVMRPTGEVLVGKRSHRVNNPNRWNFFGGSVKAGENPLQAAMRELAEETRIAVHTNQMIHQGGLCIASTRIIKYYVFSVVVAWPYLNKEHSEYRWILLEQLAREPNLHQQTFLILHEGLKFIRQSISNIYFLNIGGT